VKQFYAFGYLNLVYISHTYCRIEAWTDSKPGI